MNRECMEPILSWRERDLQIVFKQQDVHQLLSYLLFYWQEMAWRHHRRIEELTGISLPKTYGWMIGGYHLWLKNQENLSAHLSFWPKEEFRVGSYHYTVFEPSNRLTHHRHYQTLFLAPIGDAVQLQAVAEAQVQWYLVDLQTRRLIKDFPWYASLPLNHSVQQDRRWQDLKHYRTSQVDVLLQKKQYHFDAAYCDSNNHINHRAYFLVAWQELTNIHLTGLQLEEIQAVFRQEVLPDETVEIQIWQLQTQPELRPSLLEETMEIPNSDEGSDVVYLIYFLANGQEKCRLRFRLKK